MADKQTGAAEEARGTEALTGRQKAAVESRGRELIVSAAAGAGKTTVLVKRVISLLCDPVQPVDIDRLLVVTFTNAAAAEMRGRIADALADRLAQAPKDRRLRRQLALMGESRIQTIHSFCADLIRRNFALCGVSPDFSLIDEVESGRLKDRAMDIMLEEEYAAGSQAFGSLRANICEERGDTRLQQAVLLIYHKLRSHPSPGGWLDFVASRRAETPQQTGWGAAIMGHAAAQAEYAGRLAARAEAQLKQEPEIAAKYGPALEYCRQYADKLAAALQNGWDEASGVISEFQKPKMAAAPRGADPEFTGRIKGARDEFADIIEKIGKSGLSRKSDILAEEEALAGPLVAELCRLVLRFTALYDELKADRNALDFSDLEHMALRLLVDPRGEKTPLAQELSAYFAEVLVDEYQDTNEIQERILQALIGAGSSAFFVGDVKQSIYRFRLADPDIFIDRLESSGEIDGEGRRARLALSHNFRSLEPVIGVCNHVFSRLMTRDFGGIEYDDSHRLLAGRPGAAGPCELWLVETEGMGDDDEESEEKATLEARLAAARVAEIMEGEMVAEADGSLRRPQPGDFAVLLSSLKSKAPYFRRELEAAGIQVSSPEEDDFFGAVEITVMLSLLRVIDNRRQDIPLISVLRSPFFGFSADDLARTRLAGPGDDFCTALEKAALEGDKKCAGALEFLDRMERAARDCPVPQLIRLVYRETRAEAVFSALDNGAARAQNLERLHGMALGYQAGGGRGLYGFVSHIDRLIARGDKLPAKGGGAGVQIMSIHKSKGLQFPFVIIPDLAKRFNTDDSRGPVLFHQHMGIGITLRDRRLRAEYKTAAHDAIGAAIRREGAAEEMRKLYVAMTRARQRMILIASQKDVPKALDRLAAQAGQRPDPQFVAAQASAAPWVVAALLDHPGAVALRAACRGQIPGVASGDKAHLSCAIIHWSDIKRPVHTPGRGQQAQAGPADYSALLAMAGQQYAHAQAGVFPSKVTPTGVKRLIPDSGEIEGTPGKARARRFQSPQPQLRGQAARRGTALHDYLRVLDYTLPPHKPAIEAHLLEAVMAGSITPEQAGQVDTGQIAGLLASPLARRVAAAAEVWREYQFAALFTPHQLTGNGMEDEQTLLNGSVDLLLLGADGLEAVDFKSDGVPAGQEAAWAEKHRLQLQLYALAVGSIFQAKDVRKTVYFLQTGAEVQL